MNKWLVAHPTNKEQFMGRMRPGSPVLFFVLMVLLMVGWGSNEVHSCMRTNATRQLIAKNTHHYIAKLDCSLPFPDTH